MEHAISTDGTPIGYWRAGTGPPLLLVHGSVADHRRWAGISPRFEARFTVYTMDRRGRGASADATTYDIRREAEDVAAVLESIGEPAFVLGHSYGGICALEAALLANNVRRLILYEPPIPVGLPLYPPGTPDRIQDLISAGAPEAALEVFVREVARMPEQEFEVFRQSPAWATRIPLASTIPRELAFDRSYRLDSGRFADFMVPTLLLLGGDSPLPFRRATEALHSTLPNSTVVTLPGQRHVAMDTDPSRFATEVMTFLLE